MRRSILSFCLALSLVIIAILVFDFLHPPVPSLAYPIERQIKYAFTLQNRTNRPIDNVEFRIPAPLLRTSTQRRFYVETTHAYLLDGDSSGNQTLCFNFPTFPPFASKIIAIKAGLRVSARPNQSKVPDVDSYLKSEKHMESDDPDIRRLALKLKAPKKEKTSENIFKWITENIRYAGYLRNTRGARYALVHKQGDCTEFACLFVALCRANDIPARCMGGYICRRNTVLNPSDYHNWAEFHLNGAWRLADPQNRIFMKNHEDYIAMRIIHESKDRENSFHRFWFRGTGLKVRMN
jgi:transglutaminase-like putative cysteine protease